MLSRLAKILLIIILSALLIGFHRRQSPLQSRLYASNPTFTANSLFERPGDFRSICLLEPAVFLTQIIALTIPDARLPRGYLIRDDYGALGFVENLRICQLSFIDRTLRFVMWTRSVPITLLAVLFDQAPATVYADVHHIGVLWADRLQPHHIRPIIPNSQRYYELIGVGAFRHFPRVLLAVDVIKCLMRTPYNLNHAVYFDGHEHDYNFGFLLGIDANGECDEYSGHLPGSQNDLNHWYSSDLHLNPGIHFGPGDRVLGDGIFAAIHDRIIVPIGGLNRALTVRETRFNFFQQWDRSIVENYNGRLKNGCPILRYYTFGVDSINYMFVSCLILTNIRIRFQDRMRY